MVSLGTAFLWSLRVLVRISVPDNGCDGSGFSFGSWKYKNGSDGSGLRFQVGSWAILDVASSVLHSVFTKVHGFDIQSQQSESVYHVATLSISRDSEPSHL